MGGLFLYFKSKLTNIWMCVVVLRGTLTFQDCLFFFQGSLLAKHKREASGSSYNMFSFSACNLPRGNRVHTNEVLSGGSIPPAENQCPASDDER